MSDGVFSKPQSLGPEEFKEIVDSLSDEQVRLFGEALASMGEPWTPVDSPDD